MSEVIMCKTLFAFSGDEVVALEHWQSAHAPEADVDFNVMLDPDEMRVRAEAPTGGLAVLEIPVVGGKASARLRDLTQREWACLAAGVSVFENAPDGPAAGKMTTETPETPTATRQITVLFADDDKDLAESLEDLGDPRLGHDLGYPIDAPIDEPLTATIIRVAQANTEAFNDLWLLRWVALVDGKEIGRGDVDGSPYADYTVSVEQCADVPLPPLLRVGFWDLTDPKGEITMDSSRERYDTLDQAVGWAADDYTDRGGCDRANPGWLAGNGSAWVAWDEVGAEVGRGRLTAEIAWEFDVSVDPPPPAPAPDERLSPTDAMIHVLEMVRARGWEMPYRSVLNIAHTQKTGRVEADVAHFHWWDGHEMNTNHAVDAGDGGVTAWKQTRDDRVRRKWPETTTASIDAALTFIFGGAE